MASGRMHGETPEAYRLRRIFEDERAGPTRDYEQRRDAGSLPAVVVDRPCICPAYPFGHFHNEGGRLRVRS